MKKFFTIAALLLVIACSGARIRSDALLPTISVMWPAVLVQIEDAPSEVKIAAAIVGDTLATGDGAKIARSPYPIVLDYLKALINARSESGEISTGYAMILLIKVEELRAAFGVTVPE